MADLKLQEKNQQTKHQIAEVGKLAKGKGGSASVDKFLNNKPPSQKGPKRLAMVRKKIGRRSQSYLIHLFLSWLVCYRMTVKMTSNELIVW